MLLGVLGKPFLALDDLLDLRGLDAVHEEVCVALAQFPTGYTGGSHRAMGIMPPEREAEAIADYQEVIRSLDDAQFEVLRSLSDQPARFPRAGERGRVEFGEERDVPLSHRQMLWLKMRFGVYFPWKVYAELIPNERWEDKAKTRGKRFTRTAEALFPRTIAFVKGLPFSSIGRCNIMGLEAHDHGTIHRDGDPDPARAPDPFITFSPAPPGGVGQKRLYLYDPETREETDVVGRAYWFNDHDYHGVRAAPFFRYSIRVDGPFDPAFVRRLEQLEPAR
ncbi:MAG: hypothetical protein U0414_24485 [Polyangiaceae bacterium]